MSEFIRKIHEVLLKYMGCSIVANIILVNDTDNSVTISFKVNPEIPHEQKICETIISKLNEREQFDINGLPLYCKVNGYSYSLDPYKNTYDSFSITTDNFFEIA